MTASQDKVQGIVEALLEETLPLVHKGIFTAEELQTVMVQREKLENNMLKPTYKLSDYLKAIQFEYNFERQRRSRIHSMAPNNPLFKKQSKTDFVIIRRIIRLWDRTMHKFKYNLELWKQYLEFCVKTEARKQFYKALSNALRFIPFSEQLWMIGVYFETEVGLNMWKARKILLKALRMNPKKVNLWIEMFKFEINFLKTIYEREKAIAGSSTIQFITGQPPEEIEVEQQHAGQEQQQPQGEIERKFNQISLEEHDDVLVMVYEQALSRIEQDKTSQFVETIQKNLSGAIKSQNEKEVAAILKRASLKINQIIKSKNIKVKKQEAPVKLSALPSNTSHQQKLRYYETYFQESIGNISNQEIDKIISQFILKPELLAKLLVCFHSSNQEKFFSYVRETKKYKPYSFPPQVIEIFVEAGLSLQATEQIMQFCKQLIPKINANNFINNLALLQKVLRFNKKTRNFKASTDIHRSLSIIAKHKPEILERCTNWIHESANVA